MKAWLAQKHHRRDVAPPMQIPFIRPNPPKLSCHAAALAEIENSGIFSNYGPVNTRLEEKLASGMFRSSDTCVTVASATLGLMLAVKQAVGWKPRARYALMPSFTFAAAAQAALWCGLTPLFCDVTRDTWLPDADSEDMLLNQYGDEIAVILPNATFGNCLDLARYHQIAAARGIPLVCDAAASLGSLDAEDKPFGIGSQHPLIFSLHATKAFATGEGGVVYCADRKLITTIRAMGNFGFGEPRMATMPGLNSKMGEVAALLGLLKLNDFESVVENRQALFEHYRRALPEFTFQHMTGHRIAHQFVPALVPNAYRGEIPDLIAELRRRGIGAARYFVPHLAEQPFFRETCVMGDLPVTETLSRRIIALPISDTMTEDEVEYVCDVLRDSCLRHRGDPILTPSLPDTMQAAE